MESEISERIKEFVDKYLEEKLEKLLKKRLKSEINSHIDREYGKIIKGSIEKKFDEKFGKKIVCTPCISAELDDQISKSSAESDDNAEYSGGMFTGLPVSADKSEFECWGPVSSLSSIQYHDDVDLECELIVRENILAGLYRDIMDRDGYGMTKVIAPDSTVIIRGRKYEPIDKEKIKAKSPREIIDDCKHYANYIYENEKQFYCEECGRCCHMSYITDENGQRVKSEWDYIPPNPDFGIRNTWFDRFNADTWNNPENVTNFAETIDKVEEIMKEKQTYKKKPDDPYTWPFIRDYLNNILKINRCDKSMYAIKAEYKYGVIIVENVEGNSYVISNPNYVEHIKLFQDVREEYLLKKFRSYFKSANVISINIAEKLTIECEHLVIIIDDPEYSRKIYHRKVDENETYFVNIIGNLLSLLPGINNLSDLPGKSAFTFGKNRIICELSGKKYKISGYFYDYVHGLYPDQKPRENIEIFRVIARNANVYAVIVRDHMHEQTYHLFDNEFEEIMQLSQTEVNSFFSENHANINDGCRKIFGCTGISRTVKESDRIVVFNDHHDVIIDIRGKLYKYIVDICNSDDDIDNIPPYKDALFRMSGTIYFNDDSAEEHKKILPKNEYIRCFGSYPGDIPVKKPEEISPDHPEIIGRARKFYGDSNIDHFEYSSGCLILYDSDFSPLYYNATESIIMSIFDDKYTDITGKPIKSDATTTVNIADDNYTKYTNCNNNIDITDNNTEQEKPEEISEKNNNVGISREIAVNGGKQEIDPANPRDDNHTPETKREKLRSLMSIIETEILSKIDSLLG